jgi:trehalose 6-phosphate phosphatase
VSATLASARDALAASVLLGRAEWKAASVAVHWRDAFDAAAIEATARAALAPLAVAPEFELLSFAAGVELRCRRRHKGTALAAVLDAEGPEIPVAYLGDDRTDEDAFVLLADRGLAVLVAAESRTTSAAVTITPGVGVLGFFERWQVATTSASRLNATAGGGG